MLFVFGNSSYELSKCCFCDYCKVWTSCMYRVSIYLRGTKRKIIHDLLMITALKIVPLFFCVIINVVTGSL